MTTQVPKYHFISSPKTVSITGVPLSHGQPRYGVERGPQAIRANGLHRRLVHAARIVLTISSEMCCRRMTAGVLMTWAISASHKLVRYRQPRNTAKSSESVCRDK